MCGMCNSLKTKALTKDALAQKMTTFGLHYTTQRCGRLDLAFNHFHWFRGIWKRLSYYIGFKFQINAVFAELLCTETQLSTAQQWGAMPKHVGAGSQQQLPLGARHVHTACFLQRSQMSWMAQDLCTLHFSTCNIKDGSNCCCLGNLLTGVKSLKVPWLGLCVLCIHFPFTLVPWGQTLSTVVVFHITWITAHCRISLVLTAPLLIPESLHRASPRFTGHSRKLAGVMLGAILLCS